MTHYTYIFYSSNVCLLTALAWTFYTNKITAQAIILLIVAWVVTKIPKE